MKQATYRILHNGTKFRIRYRAWWTLFFWRWLKQIECGYADCSYEIFECDSREKAEEKIEQEIESFNYYWNTPSPSWKEIE